MDDLGAGPKPWKNSPLLYVHERSPLPQGDRRRSGTRQHSHIPLMFR